MLKIQIESKFIEFIQQQRVPQMIRLLNGTETIKDGPAKGKTRLESLKNKNEVFEDFKKKAMAEKGEAAVDLMFLFLTDFSKYLRNNLL